MSTIHPPAERAGNQRLAISNAVVRLFRDYLGRGPTKARTYITDNVITVLLEDTLTKSEKTLVDAGHVETVLLTRRTFQSTMREDLVDAVQDITGRDVVAFLSDNHVEPDIAAETFVCAPLAYDDGPLDGDPRQG